MRKLRHRAVKGNHQRQLVRGKIETQTENSGSTVHVPNPVLFCVTKVTAVDQAGILVYICLLKLFLPQF